MLYFSFISCIMTDETKFKTASTSSLLVAAHLSEDIIVASPADGPFRHRHDSDGVPLVHFDGDHDFHHRIDRLVLRSDHSPGLVVPEAIS